MAKQPLQIFYGLQSKQDKMIAQQEPIGPWWLAELVIDREVVGSIPAASKLN